MDKMTEQDGASLDVVGENIEALRTIFPEAFTEDKIDFETLRQLLGDAVDEGEEKYGLNWHGKKKARQIALTPSTGTLRPCPEESMDWDTTQNLFIEGDNLEVLKLLQKSYANMVKMIYIDPPYNTGKEFIYPDKFQDNLDTYLRYTGQKGQEGLKISSNTESSGRYHTNWLNMMYPRLKLARNLLKEDGAIFISIDDGEVSNIRKLCDEIFGEENFVANIVWQKKTSPDARMEISPAHDHIVVYAKTGELFHLNALPMNDERKKNYKNPDNDHRGPWASVDLTGQTGRAPKSQFYKIKTPSGIEMPPPDGRCWALAENTFHELLRDNRIWFGKTGNNRPRLKKFLSEAEGVRPWSWWDNKSVGHNQEGNQEVKKLFDDQVIFDNPKPVRLLQRIVQLSSQSSGSDILLDFFAGSGTLAHAIFSQNIFDKGDRRFILAQLPEPVSSGTNEFKSNSIALKLGYSTISDIGKERVRRAAAKIKKENPDYKGDFGFKVFKLASSNIRIWNPDRKDLEGTLLKHTEHLVPGRSEEDVLYELLLKRGVDLTVPIESKEISGKTVYSIGFGVLFACLNSTISKDEVEGLAQGIAVWHKDLSPASDTQVVFRDSAFADDVAKTNMTAILKQNAIKHVRSL